MHLGRDRALLPYFPGYFEISDSSFVSLPLLSSCVGTACADSSIISVRVPGSDSHHHLPWKQQQCKNLYCRLVPIATWCCPQNCDAWQCLTLRGPRQILWLQFWSH
ncbi:unnamed protein product [Gulo gulo]|uniref:Uncharacterized protein n=1 Tax=Gulo gulo TaxID=48420 RepID=A0A9X9LTN5_GULGU|nr:unnamed protein product [Gulo gulo]